MFVKADEYELITAESLYNLYIDKETLTIMANGYGMVFTINDNKPLCGNITISFREKMSVGMG